jgi:hypothetical protein
MITIITLITLWYFFYMHFDIISAISHCLMLLITYNKKKNFLACPLGYNQWSFLSFLLKNSAKITGVFYVINFVCQSSSFASIQYFVSRKYLKWISFRNKMNHHISCAVYKTRTITKAATTTPHLLQAIHYFFVLTYFHNINDILL